MNSWSSKPLKIDLLSHLVITAVKELLTLSQSLLQEMKGGSGMRNHTKKVIPLKIDDLEEGWVTSSTSKSRSPSKACSNIFEENVASNLHPPWAIHREKKLTQYLEPRGTWTSASVPPFSQSPAREPSWIILCPFSEQPVAGALPLYLLSHQPRAPGLRRGSQTAT